MDSMPYDPWPRGGQAFADTNLDAHLDKVAATLQTLGVRHTWETTHLVAKRAYFFGKRCGVTFHHLGLTTAVLMELERRGLTRSRMNKRGVILWHCRTKNNNAKE